MGRPRTSLHHFKFVRGHTSKFWEIAVERNAAAVRFGRIDTHEQARNQWLDHPSAAYRRVARLIAEKNRKGYREVQAV